MKTQTLTLLPALIGLALALLTLPAPAPAQWTNDPWNGMVPVCTKIYPQDFTRICQLAGGRTFIAWIDEGEIPYKIHYQVLNHQGIALLQPNGLPLIEGDWLTGWSAVSRSIIPDGVGGCIALFGDERNGSGEIYGQRFNSVGQPLWGPNGLPLVLWPGTQDITLRDFNSDSLGGYFISWAYSAGYNNTDMYLQKFTPEGIPLWGDYGVPVCTLAGNQDIQQSVPDGQGGILDVWGDNRTGSYYLYAQHLDASGNPLLLPDGIQLTNPQTGLPIAIGEAGHLADGEPDGSGGGIFSYDLSWGNWYLFRMTGAGHVLWLLGHTQQDNSWVGSPLLHPADNRIWLPVAEEHNNVWSNYLYRFDLNGNSLFGNAGIRIPGTYPYDLSLVLTSDGIEAFSYWNLGYHVAGLKASRLNNNGHLQWVSNTYMTWDGFYYWVSAGDGADGMVCAWSDGRNGLPNAGDIYSQRVLADGSLGFPMPPRPYAPDYPQFNLSSKGNSVRFTLPYAGEICLELFDLLGRKVKTLTQGYFSSGESQMLLDTQDLPSGVYLLRLTAKENSKTIKVFITL